MMNRSLMGALGVFLLAGSTASHAQGAPQPRIVERFAGTEVDRWGGEVQLFEPAYIPVRLLTVPYASWPLATQAQAPVAFYDAFWQYHQSLTGRASVGDCLAPVESDFSEPTLDSSPPGSVDAITLAQGTPVAVLGKVIYEEPAWDVTLQRIATLKYLKVETVVKNDSASLVAVDDVLSLVVNYGSAQIAGYNFCSRPKPQLSASPADGPPITEAKRFFVAGILPTHQPSHLMAADSAIFRVVDGMVYPPPGVPAFKSKPMSFSKIIASLTN